MTNKELFDECIKEAIEIARPYMLDYVVDPKTPTQQEWELALVLFKQRLKLDEK